ncbi:MAG: sn-glycerol-3-phosphate ABC transporter substrate-binding protein UgpB [Dictyoglomus sp.]|nr:sn-glycerol-3-phosphate ABC transporter substrate-binding protein UgpB [Dictyoglomus sp.]MDW8189185.1 sn-glycerol-3-phosphate ABC transporter substrate-binding protein UgpB [Dictyoglomus sp.]
MKKIVILILTLFILNVSFTQSSKKIEIEFWHAFSGRLGDLLTQHVERYNKSQDKYYVKLVYKGSYQDVLSQTIAAFRAGKAPHIAQIFEVGTATMMYAKDAIYPLYQLYKDFGEKLDVNNFIPTIRYYYSYPDGKMASMPFNSSTAILWYNKDAFQKAGLNPDNPPTTWKELMEYADKIVKAKAAKNGFTCTWFSWTQFEQFSAIHNVPFATRQNGFLGLDARLAFSHPLYRKHLENLKEMSDKGLFIYGGRDSAPGSLFLSEEVAMIIESSAAYASISANAKFKWGASFLPYYDDFLSKPYNSIIGGASLWVMRRPNMNPEEYRGVIDFFNYLKRPEIDGWWHMVTGYVPVTYGGYEYANKQDFYKQNPVGKIPIVQLTRTNPTPNTRGLRLGNLPAIRIVIYEEVEKLFQNKQDVRSTINNIMERGNKILREFEEIYKQ